MAYDEESGKERKTNMYVLLQANDVKEAFDNTIQVMKGTMGDYTIPAISESPIMDVFPYFSGEEDELEQMEKFNALKASKPENAVEAEDTMEFDAEVVADSYWFLSIASAMSLGFVSSSVLLKNAIAFFNKMYREPFRCLLLDTILNSKAVALLFKITRRDGTFVMPISS